MRFVSLLTTVAIISASSAFAQSGAPVPLDQQLQRLQQNRATAPDASTLERKTFTPTSVPVAAPAAAPEAPVATSAPALATPVPAGMSRARNGEIINSVGSGAIASLPLQLITENGINYISGGIGDEESEQLKAQASHFNIQLLITGASGEFASNVVVTLKDAKGATLVTIADAGPKVYLNAPAGSYTAEISNGHVKTLKVNAPAKGAFKSQIRL